ncbi:hypothetical protein C2G38_2179335 [Gigaspora rosea]|uniref:Uncharacterized protein n=1 Tax=Gigaspora rosea TaxID=44941 RepID=A0A397VD81_9GLOM|nr:hypothetical protein C2G38_2179335 [Gigaspora rosea]
MGYMPELMEEILANLQVEIYSLYSCALVNRYWCKISIPILWREPFEFSQSHLFISKYFSSLGECEKIILKEYGINEEFSKTIFDYARFLKALDLSSLYFQVEKWIELVFVNSNSRNDNRLKHNIIIDITNLLLKLLIENGASLHSLDLCFSRCREFKPEIFYVLGQNEQFLSQLQYLSLSEIEVDNIDSATTWLRAVENIQKKLVFVYLRYKSQEQLVEFEIVGTKFLTEFQHDFSFREPYKLITRLKSGILLQRLKLELNGDESQEYTLLLECYNDGIPDEELKKRVIQFSEILPLTLQYLKLDNSIGPYTDILLNHCNVPLKKLLIYEIYNEKIAKALIEFCIRNKTLKYVGVYEYLDLNDNIRKEVEEYVELVPFGSILVIVNFYKFLLPVDKQNFMLFYVYNCQCSNVVSRPNFKIAKIKI